MMGAGCETVLRFATEFAGDDAGGGDREEDGPFLLDALPSSCFTGEARSLGGIVSGDFLLLISSSLGSGLIISVAMILFSILINLE
jgi:hypothetical protein